MTAGLGPFDPALVIARLRDQVALLRTIGGAADYVAAYERPGAVPSAFVVLSSEAVTVTPLSGDVMLHSVVAEVDIAVAVRSYAAGARGADQMDSLLPVVSAVRVALNGWKPTIVGAEVVESMRGFGRARVLKHGADMLWWADRYSVAYKGRVG